MAKSTRTARSLLVAALSSALLVTSVAGPPPSAAASVPVTRAPGARVTQTLAHNVGVPWGIAFLPDGSALVSRRDAGVVLRVGARGGTSRVGRVPGVASNGASGGEAGLLGLAVRSDFARTRWVYAYMTTSRDNRVVRMQYRGGRLGAPHALITGIPRGLHHNGGRIAFGPDGMLYVTTGESGNGALAQRRSSLGGKILRATPGGGVPAGNPFRGSLVYSYGHRNVEGLAWDSAGRLWATEFGDHTFDELNLIRRGGNYGWPATEGRTSNPRFVSPKTVWRTDNAGPAGIAIINDVAWIGGLTGHRLWRVALHGTSAGPKQAFLTGRFGRLRTAQAAPDGSLWLTTSNTDGRATPGRRDDRVLRVIVG